MPIRTFINTTLDLIYPPRCVHCDRVDSPFCDVCLQDLRATPLDVQWHRLESGLRIVSSATHAGLLQDAVQALKYHRATYLAQPLAMRLVEIVGPHRQQFDLIIPVPMHRQRLVERGYNHAELISIALAKATQLQCIPEALVRHRATRAQVELSRQERQENVADAFRANSDVVAGQRVLLVDDVRTTGATLTACAQALHASGARAIHGATITGASLH